VALIGQAVALAAAPERLPPKPGRLSQELLDAVAGQSVVSDLTTHDAPAPFALSGTCRCHAA